MPLSRLTAYDFTTKERAYIKYNVKTIDLINLGMNKTVMAQIKNEVFHDTIIPSYPTPFLRNPRVLQVIPVPLERPANNGTRGRATAFRFDIDMDRVETLPIEEVDIGDTVGEVNTVMTVKGTGKFTANKAIEEYGYRDLSHYYSNCFGLHEVEGGVEVIYCHDFRTEDNGAVSISYRPFVNGKLADTKRAMFSDAFSFPLPKTGYFNLDKFAIFSERSYRKDNNTKYKKGFCYNHLVYTSVSSNEIFQSKLPNKYNPEEYAIQDYIFKVADVALTKKLPSFQEALNKVTSFEMLSCAFTSTLCIKLDAMYNRFVLLKNTWVIGEYDTTTEKFKMFTPIFNNELRNLNINHEDAL